MHRVVRLAVLVLCLVLVVASCGNAEEPESADEPEAAPQAEEPETDEKEQVFSVGDTVKLGPLTVTLSSVRWDEGDEHSTPEENQGWLVADMTVENTGEDTIQISSLTMFSLFDATGFERPLCLPAATEGSLDEKLEAGNRARGEVAFIVEEGQEQWELVFDPMLDIGQAVFAIATEDIGE